MRCLMHFRMVNRLETLILIAATVVVLSGCMDASLVDNESAPASIAVQGMPEHLEEVSIAVSGSGMNTAEATLAEGATVLEMPVGEELVFEATAGAYYGRTKQVVPPGGLQLSLRLENLIHNGDAEQGPVPASFDAADRERPAGWTDEEGAMWIRPYGDGALNDSPYRGSGSNFFHGGNLSTDSVISQIVDLSPRSTHIDAGKTYYRIAGLLGGWEWQDDDAILRVEFRSADDEILGTASIGPVTPEDRNDETDLRYRERWGRVPESTRSAKVILVSRYFQGQSNVDGYADDLSLTLHASRP